MLGQRWWRGLALLILLSVAAISYFGVGHLIGAFKLSEFKAALRRK
jgi:putative peptidoglycan lipid II flippase